MPKLTKDQKAKLTHTLVNKRWATIIDEDNKTDGFYEDVAEVMGVDINDISTEATKYADSVRMAVKAWLKRLPEVK